MGIMPIATLGGGQSIEYWTRDAVMDRLAAAARTLKALPGAGCFPHSGAAWWPEVVRGFWEVWNALDDADSRRRYASDRNQTRAQPSARAITAMDEALRWIGWVPDRRHCRVLWGAALGVKPGRLAREMGVSREIIRVWRTVALDQIVRRLNA